jgi:hypothetical protein
MVLMEKKALLAHKVTLDQQEQQGHKAMLAQLERKVFKELQEFQG